MREVRKSGHYVFRSAVWCLTVFVLALLMAAGYKIGETFALSLDEEILEVASVSPMLEAGVSTVNPVFRVRFTESLKLSCVSNYGFSLTRNNLSIPAKLSYDDRTKMVLIAPKSPLEPGDGYALSISPSVVSVKEHQLMENIVKRFKVE